MKKIIATLSVLLFFNCVIFAQADKELPAIKSGNADAFYIPAAVCKKFKLKSTTGSPSRKAYENMGDNAKLVMVDDQRWEAGSKNEALLWYNNKYNTIKFLSDDDKDITAKTTRPVGVDAWNVYEMKDDLKKMGEIMGLKQNAYKYTFVVDKYVARIYVQVDATATLKEIWDFVKEGIKATLAASGKGALAAQVK